MEVAVGQGMEIRAVAGGHRTKPKAIHLGALDDGMGTYWQDGGLPERVCRIGKPKATRRPLLRASRQRLLRREPNIQKPCPGNIACISAWGQADTAIFITTGSLTRCNKFCQ